MLKLHTSPFLSVSWIASRRTSEPLCIPALDPELVAFSLAGQRPAGSISGDLGVANADDFRRLFRRNVVVYSRHVAILRTGPGNCKVF